MSTQRVSTTPCSLQSRAVGEPLAGTAPTARAWVVLEHPGPWGRDAVGDSDLPETVRTRLATAKEHGVTVVLARRPERRTEAVAGDLGHRVWVARCAAGGARLRTAVLPSLDPIASWDLGAIAEGSLPALDRAEEEPLLLACTHGRRDTCCAVHGRALLGGLLDSASPQQRERIWECSHVGGHRLAPVTVTLPDGVVHGRLSPADAPRLLAATDGGRVLPDLLRGRCCVPAPLQVGEGAVRLAEVVDGAAELDTLVVQDTRVVPVPLSWPAPDAVRVEVRHRDGRAWRVSVRRSRLDAERSESCGKTPLPVDYWTAGAVEAAPDWS